MKRTVTPSQSLGVIGFEPSWSPTGEWVVYIDREYYTIHLINPKAPQKQKIFPMISGEAPQWTTKGNSVLVVWGWKIMELDCTEAKSVGEASYVESRRRVVFELENHSHRINEFCLSGSKLAFVLNESSVYTIDINGNRSDLLADGFRAVRSISWSPDGNYLVCSTNKLNGAITVIDYGTGQMRNIYPEAYDPTWSPVDPLIAFAFGSNEAVDTIGLFNFATQKSITISLNEHLFIKREVNLYYSPERSIRWSPNGKLLCCVVRERSRFGGKRDTYALCIIDVESRRIKDIIELGSGHSCSPPTWSPDGKSVVVNLAPDIILHVIKV